MDIKLNQAEQDLVLQEILNGHGSSPEEVVSQALMLLKYREILSEIIAQKYQKSFVNEDEKFHFAVYIVILSVLSLFTVCVGLWGIFLTLELYYISVHNNIAYSYVDLQGIALIFGVFIAGIILSWFIWSPVKDIVKSIRAQNRFMF